MFWTRLGSPTGRAASGTVEEIEDHLKAKKPVMLHFSSAPVRLDSVDDNQYQALRTFRAEMERRGLVESYESMTEFRDKFARQLAMTVIRHWEAADVSESSEFLDSVHPTLGSRIARLSDDAKMLLLETATDRGGMLLALDTLQGLTMTANSREFIEPKTPPVEARWRAALDELVRSGYLEDRVGKGEVFSVTHAGYTAFELLRQE